MAGVFVGRAAERAFLDRCLTTARDGSPTVVLIEAAAGAGKSALVEHFLALRGQSTVCQVSGDDAETAIQYGVYHQLMVKLARASPSTEFEDDVELTAAQHGDLQLMGDHLSQSLATVSAQGTCVVLIDDAHFSDRSSLTAVSYALRRLQSEPILTVVVSRPEGSVRLPAGLAKLVESKAARLALDGLSVPEVRELAAAYGHPGLSERAARRLRDHTGGSPLHLRALLQDRRIGCRDWLAAPLSTPLPFARLISTQLAELSDEARRLAGAAAVLGLGCDLRMAAAMTGVDNAVIAAEELKNAGLVEVVRKPHMVALTFGHSLTRAAVVENLTASTQAELHLAAAAITEGAQALVHRCAAAAGPDSALAAELLRCADNDIARGSWRTAANALLEAARVMPLGETYNHTFLRAVDALLVAGDLPVAASHHDQVAGLPPTVRRLQVQALMAWMSGDFASAEAHATKAWSLAGDLQPGERDRLAGLLAQMCIMQGKNQDAIDWSETALRSGLLDPTRRAMTTATLVGAMSLEGRGAEALNLLPTSGDLNDPGYRELVGMRGILQHLGGDPQAAATNLRIRLRPNLDDHTRGRSPIERLTATGPDGIEPNKMIILAFLAQAEFRGGNWDVAAAVAEQALGLVEDTEQYWVSPWVHAAATLVPAGRGHWDIAEYHLAAAQAMAARVGGALNRGYAHAAAVHLAACRGEPERVIDASQWFLNDGNAYHQEPGLHDWPVHYAEALVALERYDEAEAALNRWDAAAQARGHRSRIAAVARVRGDLAARRRDIGSARSAYAIALSIGDDRFDALERAVLYRNRGSFLRRRGERRAAVHDIQEAERRFVALRAQPFLTTVHAELTACGLEPRRAGTTPGRVASLTPQETAVARMVIAGRSNRDIANALVLSTKTVAYHLTHVYAKLGLESRSQLAASRILDAG